MKKKYLIIPILLIFPFLMGSNLVVRTVQNKAGTITATATFSYTDTESVVSDAETVLLLHMDNVGTNNFTDSSIYTQTITANGDATQSSTQLKFGASSLYMVGSGDYLSTDMGSDIEFGSGDFTIECFFYVGTLNNAALAAYRDGSAGWDLVLNSGGTVQFDYYDGAGLQQYLTVETINTGQWYHIAVVRNGSDLAIYFDGQETTPNSGGDTPSGSFPTQSTYDFQIGRYQNGSAYDMLGYVDEYRITKGLARYTGNFTPPSGPF